MRGDKKMPQPNEYMLKQSQAEIEYQKKLTAGTNITIDPVTNTISSAGGGSTVSYESNYTLGDILGRININGASNAIRLDLRAGDNINIVRDVTTGALVISSTGGSGTITDVVQENESVVENGIAYTEKNHIILDEDGSLPTSEIGNDYDFYASKMERIDPEITFVKSSVWSDNNDIAETSDHVYSYSMTGTSDGRAEMATYSITNLEVGATYQLKFVEQISSSATFYNEHPYGTCISENEDGTGQTKSGDPGTYDPTLRFFSYYRDTDEHEYVCTFEATQETMYLVTIFGDVYDGTSNTVSFSNLTVTKVKPEITDLWFKIPTTGWLKFYGTNSAATSVHILNSRAEWDALPDSKYTDGIIYVIKGSGGGGGSEVEANPSDPATDTLNTIGIDGTVYELAGGGGGSNLILNAEKYSLEEQVVGIWTDGKPLYQKTIFPTITEINNHTYSDNDFSNIDVGIVVDGYYVLNASHFKMGLNQIEVYQGRSYYTRTGFRDDNTLYLFVEGYTVSGNAMVTVQYTKTTDVAGSGGYQAY
jgi:hypothetical protein